MAKRSKTGTFFFVGLILLQGVGLLILLGFETGKFGESEEVPQTAATPESDGKAPAEIEAEFETIFSDYSEFLNVFLAEPGNERFELVKLSHSFYEQEPSGYAGELNVHIKLRTGESDQLGDLAGTRAFIFYFDFIGERWSYSGRHSAREMDPPDLANAAPEAEEFFERHFQAFLDGQFAFMNYWSPNR